MSKKIRVDSDRYVYFSIQVSLSISTVDGVFFFFSFQLFSGIRRIRKELEKVIVRNNHDKLETLINSDTPKRGKGKSNKPRKVRHKQKPKGTPYFSRHIRAHAHTDRLDMSTCCNNLKNSLDKKSSIFCLPRDVNKD